MVPAGKAGRRIGRVLRVFCVLSTASLALFALVNLFASYRYPLDTRAVFSGQPVFDELKSLVQRGLVPKIAVFIDGVNEQFCPTYSTNIAETFRILQHDPAAKLRAVLASLPVTRLASSAYRAELATNALYVDRALGGYAFECRCPRPDACHMQLVNTYVLNKQLIRSMAKALGFEAHFVLQPIGGYRNRFTTTPHGARRPEHPWYVSGSFERHGLNGENDHSFVGMLEDYQGEPFVDMVHYSRGVNRLIAERLYQQLAPSIVKAVAGVRGN